MKKTETMTAFLGKDTEFDGKLIFHGTIRIDGHFRGEISAAGTLEPIKDAKVSAKCKGFAEKNTRTDDSGYYELTDLEDGRWKLKVKTKGLELVKGTVEISGGGVYEQNFEYL
jgi:hypothetical protein